MEIYYIYITKKGRLVYKKLKHDNYLAIGETNQFGHKLILRTKRW